MKFTILLLLLPVLLFGQTQIGQDILGENNDGIGSNEKIDISADGTTIIIGASSNDVINTNQGNAHVFKNINNQWVQVGASLTGDLERDKFGSNVCISSDGTIVSIGAQGDSTVTITLPYIKVFKLISGQWLQLGNTIGGNTVPDFTGYKHSLSADGSKLVMRSSNSVRVYELINDIWTQIGNTIENNIDNSRYWGDIDISSEGNTFAVNLRELVGFDQNNLFYAHTVNIYRNISGAWTKIGQTLEGEEDDDQFGRSIDFSLNGNTIVIGAYLNSVNVSGSGQVKIFKFDGNSWIQKGESINGVDFGERFGRSVSISSFGNVITAGSYKNTSNGDLSGDVRVFQYLNNSWTQIGDSIIGDVAFDYLGSSVSLSGDGSKVVIGANGYDSNGGQSGLVRVFDLSQILTTNYISLENTTLVYPNPSSQTIQIKVDYTTVIEGVVIYDMLGKKVLTQTSSSINVSAFNTGTYTVKIATDKGVVVKQIIVQ